MPPLVRATADLGGPQVDAPLDLAVRCTTADPLVLGPLSDACERDAATQVARERESETERLFHARRALTPAEHHAARALATLADADPDRAKERNGAGFSASTGGPGHRLAGLLVRTGVLTPEEWTEAVRITAHHRSQVGAPDTQIAA